MAELLAANQITIAKVLDGEKGADGEMSAEQLAQLNQASEDASQAKSDASIAKTTASVAKGSIDNLEIGGRNFVPNSGTYIGWSKNAAFEILDGGALGNKQIKCSGFASGARLFANINITKLFPDKEFFTDTTLTISAYVKCDSVLTSTNTSIFARFEKYDGSEQFKEVAAWIPIDTDISGWTKISASYKFPKGTFTSAFVRIALGDVVDIYVSSIKLETGSRATDWTPAPEDVQAEIDSIKKRVVIGEDSVNIVDSTGKLLASYGDAKIELGKNAVSSIIEMCGGMARVSARYGGLTTIYSHNGEYQTTLDYDFNETKFKSKVGSNYGFYEFSYSGGVWECSYSGNNAGYVQVNLSDYGITLKTTSVNEYAGITINYWDGSEATFINADTTKPSRKLILGLAESGTSDNTDYANIEIERSKEDNVEHSKINLLTVHDEANFAGVHLDNGDIELNCSGEVLINQYNIVQRLIDMLCTAYKETVTITAGTFTSNGCNAYLVGNSLRIYISAKAKAAIAAGNIANQTMLTITFVDSKITELYSVSGAGAETGPNSQLYFRCVSSGGQHSVTVKLAAIAQSLASGEIIDANVSIPCVLNWDAY